MAKKQAIGYTSLKTMDELINNMLKRNTNFVLRKTGSSTHELLLNHRKVKAKETGNFFSGSHIIKLVIKEVGRRLEDGLYMPKNEDPDRRRINTIMFDPENIEKYVGAPCVAIDINGCYWNTARKLGVISNALFEKGMEGGEKWKKARNASIGSLNTLIKEYSGVDGQLVCKRIYRRPYNVVRLDIIDHVWEIANEIGKEIEEGFLFFLTDCFFVTKNLESKVYQLLEKNGYSGKSQNIIIEDFSRERISYVIWSTKEKQDKSHSFTYSNLVPWKRG